MEEERVPGVAGVLGDGLGGGEGEAVRLAHHEGVERVARVRARLAGIDGLRRARHGRERRSARDGRRHRREARRRVDDERDRHRLAHEAGHELLEEGAVVVLDEVAVERVRGRDLEPPALDRHEAERREPAVIEVRAQPRAQERVDPRPELVHRRDHLGARARMHVAAPRRPRDETRLPPPTPGLPDGGSLGAQRARVQAASCCVGAEVSQGPSRGSRASFVARETTGFSRDGPATDRGRVRESGAKSLQTLTSRG